jgi:hypothetical protein
LVVSTPVGDVQLGVLLPFIKDTTFPLAVSVKLRKSCNFSRLTRIK